MTVAATISASGSAVVDCVGALRRRLAVAQLHGDQEEVTRPETILSSSRPCVGGEVVKRRQPRGTPQPLTEQVAHL
jgi:hypothetical protein